MLLLRMIIFLYGMKTLELSISMQRSKPIFLVMFGPMLFAIAFSY